MSIENRNRYRRLRLTDKIPEDEWSDARVEYIINKKTVAEIAGEQGCEKRAISRLIKENRDFSALGKKRTPYKVDGFQHIIEVLLKNEDFGDAAQVMTVSESLFAMLSPKGYEGSERTLRDYLQTLPWMDWIEGKEPD